jgi:hypothetical protein
MLRTLSRIIMLSHLGVYDFFSPSNQLQFSWDNRHRTGIRKMKRLDRYYCYPASVGAPSSHVLQYEILGDYVASDHLPVVLTLEVQPEAPTRSRYKINCRYLKDKAVTDHLSAVWRS